MTGWEPAESADVVYVATPPEIVPVPSVVPLSLNVTVPVAFDGVTVAVTVTDAFSVEGFAEDARATEEEALLTVWLRADDVEALYVLIPP